MTARRADPWWSRPSIVEYGGAVHRQVAGAIRRDTASRSLLEASPEHTDTDTDTSKYFASLAHFQIYGEDIGGRAAEALLAARLPSDLRTGLVRAMWDEVRHADMLYELTASFDLGREDWSPVLGLLDLLDEGASDLEFAILHTELEALALDVFRLVQAWGGRSVFGRVYGVIAMDEASHTRLGTEVVEHLLARGASISRERLSQLLMEVPRFSFVGNEDATRNLAKFTGHDYNNLDSHLRGRMRRRHAQLSRRVIDDAG